MEDDLNTWEDITCYWIRRILLNGQTTQSNLQIKCRAYVISIKLPRTSVTELEQILLKLMQKQRRPRITKAGLRKKDKAGGTTLPDCRQYYKPTVIKRAQVLAQKQTYRSVEQNREPRNKPPYLQSIHLRQSRQAYTCRKDNLISKWC